VNQNVFDGPLAYLDPRNHLPVPLLRVPPNLVPFSPEDRVKIYVQAGWFWPLKSLKHAAVFHMLWSLLDCGKLEGVNEIADASSGNTAYCLAKLARLLGKHAVLFVPSDITETKEARLRNMGIEAEIVKCYNRPGEPSAMERAQLKGREKGCLYLGQYQNLDNIEGHVKFHIKPAWEQLDGKMTVYAGGLGTCGHVSAALEFFKRTAPVAVVAARCAPNNPLPGIRTMAALGSVQLAKDCLENEALNVFDVFQHEAYRSSSELAVEDIDGGPTTGAAKVALEKFLSSVQRLDPVAWEKLHNGDGDIVCVVMGGDAKSMYGEEKYRQALNADQIPYVDPGAVGSNYQI